MSRYDGVTYRTCSVCLGCGDVSGVPCSSCEATGVQPTVEALSLLAQSVDALDSVRAELSGSRWTIRKALALLDCGNVEHARRMLAHAVRLDEGPIYGGEE